MADTPKYITHLSIDTNALISVNWPHHGGALDDVVQTCNGLGLPVLLVGLVLAEHETIWGRRVGELVKESADTLREMGSRAPDCFDSAKVQLPDATALAGSYRKAVAEVIKRWDANILPLPDVSLEEAAARSAQH